MPLANFDSLLKQIAYPGDTPAESNLLRAWLKDHGRDFDRAEFDVRLGNGATPPADADDELKDMMRRGTQLRADCILYLDQNAVIVEVKRRGGGGAMGQLLTYRTLYMAMHPERPAPSMQLVTQSITEEVAAIFEAHGASVAVVEPMEPIE